MFLHIQYLVVQFWACGEQWKCKTTAYTFYIDSMAQGYHEYQFQSIWDNPLADGNLPCEWEKGNSHDLQAVVIKKLIDAVTGALQGTSQGKYLQFVRYS